MTVNQLFMDLKWFDFQFLEWKFGLFLYNIPLFQP